MNKTQFLGRRPFTRFLLGHWKISLAVQSYQVLTKLLSPLAICLNFYRNLHMLTSSWLSLCMKAFILFTCYSWKVGIFMMFILSSFLHSLFCSFSSASLKCWFMHSGNTNSAFKGNTWTWPPSSRASHSTPPTPFMPLLFPFFLALFLLVFFLRIPMVLNYPSWKSPTVSIIF